MHWLRRRLLGRSLHKGKIPALLWFELERTMPLLSRYDKRDKRRIRILASAILAEKHFTGVQGMLLTPFQKATLAVQIAIVVSGLEDMDSALIWLDNWHEVVVYPTAFIHLHRSILPLEGTPAGIGATDDFVTEGETSYQGAIVINWLLDQPHPLTDHADQVLIHELAHKLDMLDGSANGHPPLHRGMSEKAWFQSFEDAFEQMNQQIHLGFQVPVNAYAATSPAEFFAVASEYFFEAPDVLKEAYPKVFEQLCLFYRQDFSR